MGATVSVPCRAEPLAGPNAQRAAREAVDLAWARSPEADSCLSGFEIKRAVRERLARDPFGDAFRQQIEGTVSRRSGQWAADIVVRDLHGTRIGARHLESAAASCRELDEAVVLTVTLIIDPNAATSRVSSPTAVAATEQTKPSTAASDGVSDAAPPNSDAAPGANAAAASNAATASDTETPSSAPSVTTGDVSAPARDHGSSAPLAEKMRASASEIAGKAPNPRPPDEGNAVAASRFLLAPSMAYELLPGLAWALTLRGEVRVMRSATLELSALYFPERIHASRGTRVGYGLSALGFGSCYAPNRAVTLLGCVSGWVGAMHAVVYEGTPDRPGDRFWAAVRADLGVAAESERLVAEIRAFGVVPLTHWRYRVADGPTLFEAAVIAPGAEISVGVRFP